ncbi:hypothetical protein [Ralstonia mojiangensis]|uniref:hypothetical protein n=1 Tax=Ralstonia mojiangensis TaxID=2953895 RepID=UPI0020915A42|nr:hypothetical protein [Ralstonia mojiangensis]MCO5413493.1 hypothetical protein [Ralstonia mojiangensis]
MTASSMLGSIFGPIARKLGFPQYLARLNADTLSGWTNSYHPPITAFSKEAPTCSRRSCIYSAKLRRDIHFLSTPEQHAGLLALYHPRLFDLHEQRVLSPGPAYHPLSGHRDTRGLDLPAFKGTVSAADRLGQLKLHPTTVVSDPSDPDTNLRAPIPLMGDLLLFLRDDDNTPFCINWTVKKDEDGFKRGLGLKSTRTREENRQKRLEFRHELERVYYEDAGIRTVRVTQTKIDFNVACNLRQLYGYHQRSIGVSARTRQKIEERFRSIIGQRVTPLDVSRAIIDELGCDLHDCRTILYQGIWNRRLRVDLFSPINFDHPLKPESRDVLQVYGDWFGGAA